MNYGSLYIILTHSSGSIRCRESTFLIALCSSRVGSIDEGPLVRILGAFIRAYDFSDQILSHLSSSIFHLSSSEFLIMTPFAINEHFWSSVLSPFVRLSYVKYVTKGDTFLYRLNPKCFQIYRTYEYHIKFKAVHLNLHFQSPQSVL